MRTIIVFLFIVLVNGLFANGLRPGDPARDFRLKNVDGRMVSMADYKDAKGFILIFTCNHCPYSVAYEDRIIDLQRKYAPLAYPVIAVNPNDPAVQAADSYEKMIERARDKKFNFPYLFDDGQKVFPHYGATRTPHVFILEKVDNDLIVRYIGAIDDNHEDEAAVKVKYVEDAVDALLAGKQPPVAETRAIGCTIKVQKK